MAGNFKGKRIKDFETPIDSIIHNSDFNSSLDRKTGSINSTSITSQHFSYDPFDTFDIYTEKRNKEFK